MQADRRRAEAVAVEARHRGRVGIQPGHVRAVRPGDDQGRRCRVVRRQRRPQHPGEVQPGRADGRRRSVLGLRVPRPGGVRPNEQPPCVPFGAHAREVPEVDLQRRQGRSSRAGAARRDAAVAAGRHTGPGPCCGRRSGSGCPSAGTVLQDLGVAGGDLGPFPWCGASVEAAGRGGRARQQPRRPGPRGRHRRPPGPAGRSGPSARPRRRHR